MRHGTVLLVFAATACTVGSGQLAASPDARLGDGLPSDAAVAGLDALDIQMFAEAIGKQGFTLIDPAPYGSTVGVFNINVYVSQDAVDFRKIHPETSGSQVTLPVGTMIIRQVLDAAGQVTKVTVMAKGPAGYDPTLGDWWFGVTDPSGAPLSDASGILAGRLTQCHECHLPRATDDYLFGVPLAAQ